MTANVYNACLAIGLGLIGGGVAMISTPAALIVVGSLVIGLTLFGAHMSRKG